MWLIPSRQYLIWNLLLEKLHNEFKTLLGGSRINKGSTLIFISLFSIILFNNFIGLFPYIFTRTSHLTLTLTLTLALPLWLRFIIFGWINNTHHILVHFVPQGTPSILIPFIVCIETIRNIIRPDTLAVRLTANIIAGHLLLTLLGNNGPSIRHSLLGILISAIAVLRTLYSREVN
jgi:F-type H+-transporting ATPase subunit a